MPRRRVLLLLVLYLGLIGGGVAAGRGLTEFAVLDIWPSNEARVHGMIMTATAIYVVSAAVPFVPGAEVGWALIVTLGPDIVPLVYLSMVGALLLAFGIGRLVPARLIAAVFGYVGLARARDLALHMAPLAPEDRLQLLIAAAPRRVVPFLLRHRHLALAVAFNVPGNTLVGGGGGLAFVAGMSGLYRFPDYLLTVVLAIAPVPLLVLVTGSLP
ncbi:MAG: hypothetical protein R3225_07075 [Halofilum sp. (in: g-proteobacteria)]|nr:hypothetical protein [Halofilum sp. (in: g-proteobacteria)]